MSTAADLIDVPPGLAGVAVADTGVGDVLGDRGFFHYRGHDATALARRRGLEDVWRLLIDGQLPATAAEHDAFAAEVAALRAVPDAAWPALRAVAATGAAPVDALRSALSVVAAAEGLRPVLDLDPASRRRDALRLVAVVPTLIAALHRLGRREEPVVPDPSLPYAADYLRMVHGAPAGPAAVRAVERYLVTTIDHGFNASTFAARVITSTGADVGAALVGAVGALSGPLHGGAPSRALALLDEIGTPDRAEEVVRGILARGERIMGFGHRVYRTRDPRAVLLREVAEQLGSTRAALAAEVEDVVVRVLAEHKPGRRLYANVEYYAGVVLAEAGLPPDLFTATFAASRSIGWSAHVLEQAAAARLVRPAARYVGPAAPRPVPAVAG